MTTFHDVSLAPAAPAQAAQVTKPALSRNMQMGLTALAGIVVLAACIAVTVSMSKLAGKKTHKAGAIMGATVFAGIGAGSVGLTALALRDLNRLKQKETPPDIASRKTTKVSI